MFVGEPLWGAILLMSRMAMGTVAGVEVMRCPVTKQLWSLIPIRDLWGVAVWVGGLVGNSIQWRGASLSLAKEGRIAG